MKIPALPADFAWIPVLAFLKWARIIAEVTVEEVPAEHEDAVQQAADECPSESIIVE